MNRRQFLKKGITIVVLAVTPVEILSRVRHTPKIKVAVFEPAVPGFEEFQTKVLNEIAAGMGVPYEILVISQKNIQQPKQHLSLLKHLSKATNNTRYICG